jgi:hypothetical protein
MAQSLFEHALKTFPRPHKNSGPPNHQELMSQFWMCWNSHSQGIVCTVAAAYSHKVSKERLAKIAPVVRDRCFETDSTWTWDDDYPDMVAYGLALLWFFNHVEGPEFTEGEVIHWLESQKPMGQLTLIL